MTFDRFAHLFTHYVLHPVAGVKATYGKIFEYYYAKNALPRRQAAYSRELLDLRKFTEGDYEYWIERVERGYKDEATDVGEGPLISVIVPVYNVATELLLACIDSVRTQTYENWELILMDDCSTMKGVYECCVSAAKEDSRIKAYRQDKNGGISSATNAAIAKASGEYIALLDCDDTLADFALMEVAKVLVGENEYDLVYSDEDKIDEAGTKRYQPYFKPDFSPDSLLSYMYICHLSVYKKSVVEAVGGLRSEFDGSQDYDLALRVSEMVGPERIYHIPKILYHWRSREGSTAMGIGAKSYAIERTMRVKEDALRRRGIAGHAEISEGSEHSRVVYEVDGTDLVSVIIPSKDHPEVLRTCLESLRKYTGYKNYEIIVVDNGSNEENKGEYERIIGRTKDEEHPLPRYAGPPPKGEDRSNLELFPIAHYVYEPMDFNFSRMCNIGAKHASGEYLLFLNDDTEILEAHPEWMERMLGAAAQSHVGAVGAKLLYGDGDSIQHCGVVNTRSGPGHMFCTFTDTDPHYFNKNKLDIDVIAVTAACLMISREKFDLISGFDESFAVAYNDIDFCFKLHEAGLYNVVRNDAILIHHESISRGSDFLDAKKIARLFSERTRLYERHPALFNHDPYYNINLNQFAPDHQFNYDFDYDFYCVRMGEEESCSTPPSPAAPGLPPVGGDKDEVHPLPRFAGAPPEGEDKIRFDITNIIVDWAVHIVGWVLFLPDNDLGAFDMLLVNREDGSAYRMATKRMYITEVGRAYYRVPNSEFGGFRTMSDRTLLKPGEYDIYFLKDGVRYETGKRVKI